MKLLPFIGLSAVIIPVLLSIILAVYDYNKWIQIPYWTMFGICYLFTDSDLEMCTPAQMKGWANWTIAKWNWQLETHQPGSNTPIPEMQAEDFSYELLEKMTKGFSQPVVIRGLFAKSDAVRKWTPEFFTEKYGNDTLVILGEGRTEEQYNIVKEIATTATRSNSDSGYGYQKVMQPYKMKLGNALRQMKDGAKLYLSNVDTIFRRNNDLLDDLNFTTIVKPWAYENYTPYAAQMFLGYGVSDTKETTGTIMHSAANANIFVQAQGAKDWKFVHPRYTIFLGPKLGKMTPAATVGHPPINVPTQWVTLNTGDGMLNPPWYWHEIRNREGFNVGVATRENHPVWILRNNWIFSSLLEFRATPRVAKNLIPKEQRVARFLAGVPFLTFYMVYLKEWLSGPGSNPLFTAAFNPCDEHDPNSCVTTFLDKTVYSEDIAPIPYRD